MDLNFYLNQEENIKVESNSLKIKFKFNLAFTFF